MKNAFFIDRDTAQILSPGKTFDVKLCVLCASAWNSAATHSDQKLPGKDSNLE
jgi:hypothetical protein